MKLSQLSNEELLKHIRVYEARLVALQESWARMALKFYYDAELENTERYLSELLVEAHNRGLK